ncbi:VanZ family protein [Rheinheimera sp.]|uniref:VanZ family protein n=1 Tax=Rheinheimera sp. TaxID=1869214 RepID=UPI002FDCA79A
MTQLDFSGSKTLAFALTLLCSLFIIYGSWLPFTLSGVDLTQAWQQFLQLWQQESTSFSGVDFGTNILLTIPLAFFAAAWLQQLKPFTLRYPLIVLYCLLLAFVVELGQLMFSGRVASPYDVLAQGIGAVLGLLLWHQAGQAIWPLLSQLTHEISSGSVWYRLAILYAVVFFVYNVLPLDLTLNPEGIYDKWKAGKILLLPFQYKDGPWFEISYAVISDVAVWLPLAYFVLRASKVHQPAVLYVALYSVVTEIIQLFVMSRTTDIGDVIYALLAVTALKMLKVQRQEQQQRGEPQHNTTPTPGTAACQQSSLFFILTAWAVWSCVLLIVFWFPFNFSTSHIKAKITFEQWFSMPFTELFRDSLLTAVSTMLQKTLLFAPLGWLLAMLRLRCTTLWLVAAVLLVVCQIVLIELGQIFLPDKFSNLTDVIIAVVVVGLTFVVGRFFIQDKQVSPTAVKPVVVQLPHHNYIITAVKFVLTVVVFVYLGRQSFIPYNIRELVGAGQLWQALMVTAAFFLCFSFWSIRLQRPQRPGLLQLPFLLFVHSQLFYWLLYVAVPLEVLQDIVGASHWQFFPALEMALRFSAFFLMLQLPLLLNAILDCGYKRLLLPLWIVLWPFAVLIWHLVVVTYAITDNITELLTENGVWYSSILLWLWLQSLLFCSHWLSHLARELSIRIILTRGALLVAVVYFSFSLISMALESHIYKYNQSFSALQFLLSPDRKNYLSLDGVMFNYYVAVITVIFSVLWFKLSLKSVVDEKVE